MAYFVFQEMFAIITPALITGAFADRVSFKSYLIFLVLWSILVYTPLAHWAWGGGFLSQMGFADFAGGIVVHTSAGFAALASVLFIGKRHIKKGEKVLPHNVTYVALGAALLWFGWFGFNGGSALGSNGLAAVAFVNTDVAASLAMITWMIIDWIHNGKAQHGRRDDRFSCRTGNDHTSGWLCSTLGSGCDRHHLLPLSATVRSCCADEWAGMMLWMFGVFTVWAARSARFWLAYLRRLL